MYGAYILATYVRDSDDDSGGSGGTHLCSFGELVENYAKSLKQVCNAKEEANVKNENKKTT